MKINKYIDENINTQQDINANENLESIKSM